MAGKILIIEDNQLNMELLIEMLKAGGNWEIITAFDGETGVEKAIKESPDLILLDIQLPGLDGYQILQMIRNEEDLYSVPVIGVTAYAARGDREKVLNAGFNDYISKPIDLSRLYSVVNKYL